MSKAWCEVSSRTSSGRKFSAHAAQVTERRQSVGVLNSHLLCVLCSGYLIDATGIVECLHRFCKSCIVKYLKSNSFCPICDVQINQAKLWDSLRPDTTIQSLVYKLVPGLYKSEMARRCQFYAENDLEVPEGEAGGQPPEGAMFYSEGDTLCLSLEYYYGDDEFKFPDEDTNDEMSLKRYLRCPAGVSMRHLKKLLMLKFALASENHIDIIYNDECLKDTFTLMDVAYTFNWNGNDPMRFAYRIYKKPKYQPVSDGMKEAAQLPKDSSSDFNTNIDQQQRQSEYLGHLNLNPTGKSNGATEQSDNSQAGKDEESDSNNSELRIVSEKETAPEGQSSEEEYQPKSIRRHGKRKRHDSLKGSPGKRRRSDTYADELKRKLLLEKKKRRKSLAAAAETNSDDGNLKNEALKKVFVYKEKPDRKDGEFKKKKRKKSKHHENEAKRKKSDNSTAPAILSVDKSALKLKVKLAPLKPREDAPTTKDEEGKSNKERLLHLRAVRHKNVLHKKDYITASPSLTISKVDSNDQAPQKTSLVESKPSLEIMLVKKSEECNGSASESFGVLDLSDKSTRPKDIPSPVDCNPKKSTQQSILQIAETLVNRKLSPNSEQLKSTDQSVAVVAMRDLKTLSDAAVNILMAAQQSQQVQQNAGQSPPKRPENGQPLKIPMFPKERPNPIPPIPNLHQIYPYRRGRPPANSPAYRLLPPKVKPGQNQIVRQIPDPSVVLNRQNNVMNHVQNRPDSSTSPEKSKLDSIPPLKKLLQMPTGDRRPPTPKPPVNNHHLKLVQNSAPVMPQNTVSSSTVSSMKMPPPITPLRRVEHMSKNIESVAAGLTARATAMIDAK